MQERAKKLGEYRERVDIAPSGQRISSAIAEQLALAVCFPQRFAEFGKKSRVLPFESGDHSPSGCRVLGVRDFRIALCEDLLLLELYSLPGGVADDDREATS